MPTSFTEPNTLSDWLKWEQGNLYSRDQVTVLTDGAVAGAAVAGGTGNGTIGTLSAGTGCKPGVYVATCIEPATNAGKFEVVDPDGVNVGVATVGVAFTGPVNFTIADGATDFASGDQFTITVAAGSGKVKASPDTAADGSAVACGILLKDVDASSADQQGVIIARNAQISPLGLIFDATVNNATKQAAKLAQLTALGIVTRTAA
jgi:hypothetical protein